MHVHYWTSVYVRNESHLICAYFNPGGPCTFKSIGFQTLTHVCECGPFNMFFTGIRVDPVFNPRIWLYPCLWMWAFKLEILLHTSKLKMLKFPQDPSTSLRNSSVLFARLKERSINFTKIPTNISFMRRSSLKHIAHHPSCMLYLTLRSV